MSKNVAVFVDVANIFYAAKAAGVDIDYVTLLKSAIAGRDFVRAYAYTGLDPDNENQRNFHDFLRRHGYKVVSKDIRKYGDGKVKANLDIELVVDMLKTARNLDVAIVVSGDGDFAPAIRAVQEMGVRVEVISFRGNTSSDLMDVADQFTDIVQIARVEKGTSRSGRRVADDDEDLSMTEVPDKQTEGTGRGRGTTRRTTSRTRTTEAEREPVAAAGRSSVRAGRSPSEDAVAASAAQALVALPGERLSKVPHAAPADSAEHDLADEAIVEEDLAVEPAAAEIGADAEAGDHRRRRRRRGGRGRGRGRGRADEVGIADSAEPARPVAFDVDEDEDVPTPPRTPKSAAFGSVWDSQTGQARTPSVESTPFDLEDEEEPAIPEYLLAEQRRGAGGRVQPGRGNRGRGGYAAAIDRERYGRGSGGGGAAFNRYPDVSGRTGARGGAPRRDDRPPPSERPIDRPAGGRSDEPWSEVPPELEAMLRAQLASRPGGQSTERRTSEPRPAKRVPSTQPSATNGASGSGEGASEAVGAAASGPDVAAAPSPTPTRRRSTASRTSRTSSPTAAKAEAVPSSSGEAAPKSATPKRSKTSAGGNASKRTTSSRTKTGSPPTEAAGAEVAGVAAEPKAPKTPTRRTTTKKVETNEA